MAPLTCNWRRALCIIGFALKGPPKWGFGVILGVSAKILVGKYIPPQNWRFVAPRPYAVENSWPDLGNSLALGAGLQRGVNSISLQCVPWPSYGLLWVRCLFDRFSISYFGGKWFLKWKISKTTFQIPRRDTELRFVTKFGENRPLRSCRKILWITTHKNSGSAGFVPAPILPKTGRSRPKFPERCHPFAGLIPERLIFRPQK